MMWLRLMKFLVDEKKCWNRSDSTGNSSQRRTFAKKMNSCAWRDGWSEEFAGARKQWTNGAADWALQAVNDRVLKRTRTSQRREFKSKKAKVSGHAFSVDNPGLDLKSRHSPGTFPWRRRLYHSRNLTNTKAPIKIIRCLPYVFTNGKESILATTTFTDKPKKRPDGVPRTRSKCLQLGERFSTNSEGLWQEMTRSPMPKERPTTPENELWIPRQYANRCLWRRLSSASMSDIPTALKSSTSHRCRILGCRKNHTMAWEARMSPCLRTIPQVIKVPLETENFSTNGSGFGLIGLWIKRLKRAF